MLLHDFAAWAVNRQVDEDILIKQEERSLAGRRLALGLDEKAPKVGLALSGGGIRSATFSLGLIRELAAQRLLHKVDYLSTVSGGSYIGSYLAGLFARREVGGEEREPVLDRTSFAAGADPFEAPDGLARASIEWLRQSGRYLAPQGAGDYWKAAGLLARNWLGLHFVIGATLMLIALLAVAIRFIIYQGLAAHEFTLPAWLVHAPMLVLLAPPVALHVAVGWAYWLTRRDLGGWKSGTNSAQIGSLVILGGAVWTAISPGVARLFSADAAGVQTVQIVSWLIAASAASGLFALLLSWIFAGTAVNDEEAWDHRRTFLTAPMSLCAGLVAAIVVAAAADALSFFVFRTITSGFTLGALVSAGSALLVPTGRSLVSRLTKIAGSMPSPRPDKTDSTDGTRTAPRRILNMDMLTKLGAVVAALLLMVMIATFWSVLAYKTSWPMVDSGKLPSAPAVATSAQPIPCVVPVPSGLVAWRGCTILDKSRVMQTITTWTLWFSILAVLSFFIARTTTFLNLSGLTSFYAGRLRRAYLGAGNRNRLEPGSSKGLDKWESYDDITLANYYRAVTPDDIDAARAPGKDGDAARDRLRAGPLHLINITLNETRSAGSAIVQQDRRGRNLTLSPAGLYCSGDSRRHLYRIDYDDEKHEHEELPLSSWVAISGAAFSTGLGARSGFPLSQLAGLANVRLGYWWRAAQTRIASITQWDLLREFRGDFSGPYKKYWYLSDGGHFENTGAYELIRRRLPLIMVSDNGMDERFEYEDVANLVRKARIDFDCEIDFLDDKGLDRVFEANLPLRANFGSLTDVAGGGDPANISAFAALARLRYDAGTPQASEGTLLLIKPRLTGSGPVDLIRYKEANSTFPQQTTLDQFFDEAQWESYYHLGRLIAQALFNRRPPLGPLKQGEWVPASLKPLP